MKMMISVCFAWWKLKGYFIFGKSGPSFRTNIPGKKKTNQATLRIIGPCYRGVWMCIAGVWDLQTTSFEIPWFLGYVKFKATISLRTYPSTSWTTKQNNRWILEERAFFSPSGTKKKLVLLIQIEIWEIDIRDQRHLWPQKTVEGRNLKFWSRRWLMFPAGSTL